MCDTDEPMKSTGRQPTAARRKAPKQKQQTQKKQRKKREKKRKKKKQLLKMQAGADGTQGFYGKNFTP